MSAGTLRVEVLRYVPERHEAPVVQAWSVPREPAWSLLDVLGHVHDHLDASLAWRWSCRMGICGSCGVMVDGEPRLACETFVRDLGETVRVEALTHFPIERDLVIDQTPFFEKLERVTPWLVAPDDPGPLGPVGERLQTPAELARFDEPSQCIHCLLCYAACPQVALGDDFLGPAAIAVGHRYQQDSRDAGAALRAPALHDADGVWACTLVGSCSAVCPKGVEPATAIQQEKGAGLLGWARRVLWPRGAP